METKGLKTLYKALTFKSESAFQEWLGKTTYLVIDLVDHGQDVLKIHVARNGEILHTDWQASVWNGSFIRLKRLEINKPIQLLSEEDEEWRTMSFIPEKITAGSDMSGFEQVKWIFNANRSNVYRPKEIIGMIEVLADTTVTKYLDWLRVAGYLNREHVGKYSFLKYMPLDLTSANLEKEAFPHRVCYKTGKICTHRCEGSCKENY